MNEVLTEVHDQIAVVTLNRPEQKNAMSRELLDQFASTIDELAKDRQLRALVITGAGRSFSSGADFTALASFAGSSGLEGQVATQQAIRSFYDALQTVERVPIPTIAAVNGAAVGGGLGLALLCDIRVVADDAKMGANFARLGIHPGLGISRRLVEVIGYEATAELLFTGELRTGRELTQVGFARHCVAREDVLTRAMDVAAAIAKSAPLSVRQIKKTLTMIGRHNLDLTMEVESFAQALLSQTKDASEGVQAMLERRDPNFSGR